jgi:hypothetical protein
MSGANAGVLPSDRYVCVCVGVFFFTDMHARLRDRFAHVWCDKHRRPPPLLTATATATTATQPIASSTKRRSLLMIRAIRCVTRVRAWFHACLRWRPCTPLNTTIQYDVLPQELEAAQTETLKAKKGPSTVSGGRVHCVIAVVESTCVIVC